MRKPFLLLTFLCLALQGLYAQDTVRLKQQGPQSRIITDRPPQAVYFQVGGSGPILSANYDRRFGKKVNGLGFTAGIGYWHDFEGFLSVPVSINYLFGRRTHFLEAAAGATFLTYDDYFDDGGLVFYHVNLGYRHQPTTGGFFFRGGFSPLFTGEGAITSFYLGFGHNF